MREGMYAFCFSFWNRVDVNSPMTTRGLALVPQDSTCLYLVVSPTCALISTMRRKEFLFFPSARAHICGPKEQELVFLLQRFALKQGYDQIFWLLGEDEKVTEVGAIHFFLVLKREDGGACALLFTIYFFLILMNLL